MNSSLFTCNRTTHLKIVAVAIVASIVAIATGLYARTGDNVLTARVETGAPVLKAGKPVNYSTRDASAIR